ncbi:ArsR family transcriptional regulator [Halohasta litchfieldiae]|jgi:ArsR family transcriptional regulator|uniref:Transcriptional regulator, ArsR family n=1 Tax=Halohasta litchfieldiae TaxID=1073996 RepID=A0A1H6V637_9EURY|nr:metalloregulator ArsR/SmtB family transcription factor [Halohasta litchfieldiae]ATW87580.1 ArsR family transcriptional regulator [Halohasta litchfieldiae]SEI97287.1 transcriptional regulator, ArsR family [Halohasta litchfieldiae]
MTESTASTGELPDSLTRLYDDPEAEAAALRERAGNAAVADRVSSLCAALSNPLRLRLLWALRDGECCVCELQTAVEAPQSTVATQLKCLTDAGLVTTRKEGKWSYYSVADTEIFELIDHATEFVDPVEATE